MTGAQGRMLAFLLGIALAGGYSVVEPVLRRYGPLVADLVSR